MLVSSTVAKSFSITAASQPASQPVSQPASQDPFTAILFNITFTLS
jgi:hypothetical protein